MHTALSRLAAALGHRLSLDDYVELALPLWSSSEVRARVLAVRPETHDVATLVLEPNGRWRGHRAGQHVALTVPIRGVRRTRVMHGQYDVAGDPRLSSTTYEWDSVCSADQWRHSHNYLHHTFTNVQAWTRISATACKTTFEDAA